MSLLGRDNELAILASGLSSSGKMRAALLTGESGIGKTALMSALGERLRRQDPALLWLYPQSIAASSPAEWVSQITRNLQSGDDLAREAVNAFAKQIGKDMATVPSRFDASKAEDEKVHFSKVAQSWVSAMDTLMSSSPGKQFTPVFAMDDLDQYPAKLREWIVGDLNQALRESINFKNARFLFSAKSKTGTISDFLAKFGIEQVHDFPLSGLSVSVTGQLFKLHNKEDFSLQAVFNKTGGVPAKILSLASKRLNLENTITSKMSQGSTSKDFDLGKLSDEEVSHLIHAAYPDRINRYSLEFFCPPREAAYAYNWIKRNKQLGIVDQAGNLVLNPDIRAEIKKLHSERNATEAEDWENLAFVLNTFVEIFPNPDLHWIPVNLQLFNCFNKKLCREIFSEVNYEEIIDFLEEYAEIFTITGKQYKMLDDVKLITSRFIEVGGIQPTEGLVEEIRIKWEEDQRRAEEQRLSMEEEKKNLLTEELQAKKQIETLGELKQKILDDFRKPKNFKPQRVYSVSTSPILIVLGIITIGASLFSDSIGSYYAGAGIILTILGFFWPSVEVKRPAYAGGKSGPNLAIETQQRSLEHRIIGLKNRINSMSGSIERISSELEKVNSGVSEPYLLEE